MDTELVRKIDSVHKFSVRENKANTYALDKDTINTMLRLCALVANMSGVDDCGTCDGCLVVIDLKRVFSAEMRRFVS